MGGRGASSGLIPANDRQGKIKIKHQAMPPHLLSFKDFLLLTLQDIVDFLDVLVSKLLDFILGLSEIIF